MRYTETANSISDVVAHIDTLGSQITLLSKKIKEVEAGLLENPVINFQQKKIRQLESIVHQQNEEIKKRPPKKKTAKDDDDIKLELSKPEASS